MHIPFNTVLDNYSNAFYIMNTSSMIVLQQLMPYIHQPCCASRMCGNASENKIYNNVEELQLQTYAYLPKLSNLCIHGEVMWTALRYKHNQLCYALSGNHPRNRNCRSESQMEKISFRALQRYSFEDCINTKLIVQQTSK